MFKKYIAHNDQEELEAVTRVIEKPAKKQRAILKGFTKRIVKQESIEVFDVIVRSKMRLQLFDLDFGKEIQFNQTKSDYLERMERQQ